jgi:hypothetical protein
MPETAQKYELSFLRACRKVDISWDGLQFTESAQKYDLSFLRACRKVDISRDGLRFLCISLCRRLLKSMSDPISDHAQKLGISWDGLQFYALACAGAYSKVWVILSERAENLILAETVFNFYALAGAGACSKVWVIPSQIMQTNWY